MKIRLAAVSCASLPLFALPLQAQDLGPHVRKIKDGIYVYAAKPQDSNVSIILTKEGVVMIDTGQTPADSRAVAVIAHAGAGESMKKAAAGTVERNQKFAAEYPGERGALKGYRQVLPTVEYQQKMALNAGDRNFELIHLKNVHSEADTAIWLPDERVLWATAAVGVKRYPNIRPFLTIPDILAAIKLMRALNPEVVIAGHGAPGTARIFDEMERYYALLLERVGRMAREGKTLETIKADLRMPEFDDWAGKERFPSNVEAAWRAAKGS